MVNVVKAIDAGELESGFENVELVLRSADQKTAVIYIDLITR